MQTLPKNIRISQEMDEKLDLLVKKTGKIKADLMRAAMELGLEDLMLVKKTDMERLQDEVRAAKSQLRAMDSETEKARKAK